MSKPMRKELKRLSTILRKYPKFYIYNYRNTYIDIELNQLIDKNKRFKHIYSPTKSEKVLNKKIKKEAKILSKQMFDIVFGDYKGLVQ
jgi:hypothetical protein